VAEGGNNFGLELFTAAAFGHKDKANADNFYVYLNFKTGEMIPHSLENWAKARANQTQTRDEAGMLVQSVLIS